MLSPNHSRSLLSPFPRMMATICKHATHAEYPCSPRQSNMASMIGTLGTPRSAAPTAGGSYPTYLHREICNPAQMLKLRFEFLVLRSQCLGHGSCHLLAVSLVSDYTQRVGKAWRISGLKSSHRSTIRRMSQNWHCFGVWVWRGGQSVLAD